MKIGFFGDSFSDGTSSVKNSWMYHLSSSLNYEPFYYALSGTSIWNAYQNFLSYYEKLDVICFTYSYVNRIHYLPAKYQGCEYYDPGLDITHLDKELQQIIKTYWKHLQSYQLDQFIYQKIFDEVNKLCYNEDRKVINVMPFEVDHNTISLAERQGNCYTGLYYISTNETDDIVHPDNRVCHLSNENNKIFASMLEQNFNTDNKIFNINSSNTYQFKLRTMQ